MIKNGTVVADEKPDTINLGNIYNLNKYNIAFCTILIDYQDFDNDSKDDNVQSTHKFTVIVWMKIRQ